MPRWWHRRRSKGIEKSSASTPTSSFTESTDNTASPWFHDVELARVTGHFAEECITT
jgi:hypothetical protein